MVSIYVFGQGTVEVERNEAVRLFNTGSNLYDEGKTRIDFPVSNSPGKKVIKYVKFAEEEAERKRRSKTVLGYVLRILNR